MPPSVLEHGRGRSNQIHTQSGLTGKVCRCDRYDQHRRRNARHADRSKGQRPAVRGFRFRHRRSLQHGGDVERIRRVCRCRRHADQSIRLSDRRCGRDQHHPDRDGQVQADAVRDRYRHRNRIGGLNELLIEPASVDPVNPEGMTKAELLEYAGANGIGGVSSSMLKADILAVIKEAV